MQHNATEQAWLSEAALHMLDESPAQTALLDRDGRIVYVNEAWSRFAAENGGDAGRVGVGQNYLAASRASREGQDAARALEDVLRRKAPLRTLEYPCHSPTERRWFRLRCVLLDAPPLAAAVIHDDLTDHYLADEARARLEREVARVRELERDEARMTQALNTIGHTLRTPLTPVRLQMATLARTPLPPEAEAIVSKMRTSAERLVATVNEAVRAIELQQAPLRLVRLDAAEAASKLQDLLRHDEALENVSWHARTARDVHIDLPLIAPPIAELLRMAKARDREGHAEIDLEFDGRAHVTVRHHGAAPDAEGDTNPGLGLAVYMCRAVARLHGGAFLIEDQGGTVTYRMELPPG